MDKKDSPFPWENPNAQGNWEAPREETSKTPDDLTGMARDIVRELRATSGLVIDAAKLGKNELLHYVQESMRSGWAGTAGSGKAAAPGAKSAPNYSYTGPRQQKASERAAFTGAARPAAAAADKRCRRVSRGRWALFVCSLPFLIGAFCCGAVAATYYAMGYGTLIPLLATALGLCVPGGLLMSLFSGKTRRERRYARYLTAVGRQPYMSVRQIARIVRVSEKRAANDLSDMAARGYFGRDAYVDLSRQLLVIDRAAAERLETEAPPAAQRAPEAATAAPAQSSAAPTPPKATAAPDVYEKMLQELRALNERIEDDAMSDRIYRIEAVARATFLAVKEKPEKKPQIQRFMDYYLPTTIKLLDSYAGFEEQDVSGDNIRRSKASIEKMTETLSVAFEKQFDSLFLAESMDINAEIQTMDSLLRQDGFVGGMTMPGK